jgi:hypothetical protein
MTVTPLPVVSDGDPVALTPWRLSPRSVAELSADTSVLVDGIGFDLARDSTIDVSHALEDDRGLTVERLLTAGGIRALARMDPTVSPELTWTDLYGPAATKLSAGRDFDKPYAGSVGIVRPLGINDLLVESEHELVTAERFELQSEVANTLETPGVGWLAT